MADMQVMKQKKSKKKGRKEKGKKKRNKQRNEKQSFDAKRKASAYEKTLLS